MSLKFNTCIYEAKKGIFSDKISKEELRLLGFECFYKFGEEKEFVSNLLDKNLDVLIFCDEGMDSDKINKIFSAIQFDCDKHIIICYKNFVNYNKGLNSIFTERLKYLSVQDVNFDLMLQIELLKIKQNKDLEIQERKKFLQTKICEKLYAYKFSGKLQGFKYFMEAIMIVYLNFPQTCPMMELYRIIADKYNKTSSAVEKDMRTILLKALHDIRNLPETVENQKIKSTLTIEMSTNKAIGVIVSKLILDKVEGL